MQKRNMATATVNLNTPGAIWRPWKIEDAVTQGYKISGWAYKAISLISKNISSVPWRIEDGNNEPVPGHPLTLLMEQPNPTFSMQDTMELLSGWQQLSGEAYLKIIFVNGQPAELWPISPDRISPIESKDQMQLVDGYEIVNEKGVRVRSTEFTPENVIPFKFLDPANPIRGIGPLQVAAKSVDIDVEQLNWNKAAMQNRGILDGVFTFKENLDETKYNSIKRRIKELFGGKRDIGVIGSNATYQRLAMTPAEMDFITSRKFNREEIFIIFGVPPQLAGVQEATTYNNFNTARIVFWETTLIPVLDDIRNTLNRAFKPFLSDGFTLEYDISDVTALQKDRKEQVDTAKTLASMGVPVEQINEMLELGIPEYDDWNLPVIPTNSGTSVEGRAENGLMLKKFEERTIDDEIQRKETLAEKSVNQFTRALKEQQVLIFDAMGNNRDLRGELLNVEDSLLEKAVSDLYIKVAEDSADNLLLRSAREYEIRAISEELSAEINSILDAERTILNEVSLINIFTVDNVLKEIVDGEAEGKSISQIQQGILDTGMFSPDRALRIARTVSGTAQSIGQLAAGKNAGATKKVWHDSNFEVRQEHRNRDGETVGIDERFSIQFAGGTAPRYPLDQNMITADRINCFLPDTLIEANVLGVTRAFYEGSIVEIKTSSGKIVRVTNNHPMLSENGFIFACKIQVGDNLVTRIINDDRSSSLESNIYHKPTPIHQIFRSFSESEFNEVRSSNATNFYGDGEFINSDINIVWADASLLTTSNSEGSERSKDIHFEFENMRNVSHSGFTSNNFGAESISSSTPSLVGASALPFDTARSSFDNFPLKFVSFGRSSGLYAAFSQLSVNRTTTNADSSRDNINRGSFRESINNSVANISSNSTLGLAPPSFGALFRSEDRGARVLDNSVCSSKSDSELISEFLNSNSSCIQLDEVISVDNSFFSGHVYDVITPNGAVSGNGIITSNCRCSMSFE